MSAGLGSGNIGGAWRYDPNFSEYRAPNPVDAGFQFPNNNGGASGTPICDGVLPPTSGFNEPTTGDQAVKFLNGTYSFSNATASWDFERNLLEQMIRFPNSFAGEASAQNYYTGKVNSVVWNFAKATRMLHDAAVISASQQASIDQIYASDTQYASDLTNIEIAEGADTSTVEPTLQSNKTTILAQMAQNRQQLTTIQSSISAARGSGYDAAISFINNLSASNVLESNQKTVLLLQARYLKGEAWTVSDSASLRNIAYSCPETGGEAVFTARGMLPAPERYNFNEVEAYCESGQRSGKEIAQNHLTETLLFPNPANDKVTVGFNSRFSGQVEILTLDGKVLVKATCDDCIQKEIDTKGLPNGLYLVRLTERGGIGQTIKLSIAR